MNFAWGATRFVILTEHFAIKLPRPRPLWALKRLFESLRDGKTQAMLEKYHSSLLVAGLKYLCIGIWMNMVEHEVWTSTEHPNLVPTLWAFPGLINIQPRGVPVTEEELERENPFRDLREFDRMKYDLAQAKNFVRLGGRVLLADYGQIELRKYLLPRRVMAV